jgi:hypothetical protein
MSPTSPPHPSLRSASDSASLRQIMFLSSIIRARLPICGDDLGGHAPCPHWSRPAKPRALDPDPMHATIDRLKAIADASGDAFLMEGPVHPDAALLDLRGCVLQLERVKAAIWKEERESRDAEMLHHTKEGDARWQAGRASPPCSEASGIPVCRAGCV